MKSTQTQPLYSVPALRLPVLRRALETAGWYVVLSAVAVVTVFPFIWVLFTSLKGPGDAIYSVPPQLIPHDFTIANYVRVWNQLPIAHFFLNSVIVTGVVVVVNLFFTALAAYPFAKMRFRGRDAVFYVLLATFIVPPQLTYIPSFVLAVRFFHYYDTLFSLILPGLGSSGPQHWLAA